MRIVMLTQIKRSVLISDSNHFACSFDTVCARAARVRACVSATVCYVCVLACACIVNAFLRSKGAMRQKLLAGSIPSAASAWPRGQASLQESRAHKLLSRPCVPESTGSERGHGSQHGYLCGRCVTGFLREAGRCPCGHIKAHGCHCKCSRCLA